VRIAVLSDSLTTQDLLLSNGSPGLPPLCPHHHLGCRQSAAARGAWYQCAGRVRSLVWPRHTADLQLDDAGMDANSWGLRRLAWTGTAQTERQDCRLASSGCKSASTNFAFTCSANLHFLVHSILSTSFSKSITLPSRHVGRQMHQKRGLPEAMPPGRPSSLKNAPAPSNYAMDIPMEREQHGQSREHYPSASRVCRCGP
jgi:hypothetical protein